jgi:diacylglycerol kinase
MDEEEGGAYSLDEIKALMKNGKARYAALCVFSVVIILAFFCRFQSVRLLN